MTSHRLFASAPGPANVNAYNSTPFIAGVLWTVTAGGHWFEGYWWWVAGDGDTTPVKCALWSIGSSDTSRVRVIPGSVVTSGTLTRGQWNFVPLAAPVQVAIGTQYAAWAGWQPVAGFPISSGQFGTGGVYAAGITDGPLHAYSDGTHGGTSMCPWSGVWDAQGVFSTSSADPEDITITVSNSSSSNFWVDLQITGTDPAGYKGPWSSRPNGSAVPSSASVPDLSVNYEPAVEVLAADDCEVTHVGYCSAAGSAQLATWCGVWDVATRTLLGSSAAPSWSGAAGTGDVYAALPSPVRLSAGQRIKLAVHNDAAVPDEWMYKDTTDRWGTGVLASGITAGPVTFTGLAASSAAFGYNNNPAGTPPYSDGSVITHGQSTFGQTAPSVTPPPYPELWAPSGTGDGTQDYFIDGIFALAAPAGALMAAGIV